MAKSVSVIGVDPGELYWLRLLVQLLRHPDPTMPELTCQALLYIAKGAHLNSEPESNPLDYAG